MATPETREWASSSGKVCLDLPMGCVYDCSKSGVVDGHVEDWASRLGLELSADDVRAELAEYGAWDTEELQDDDANLRRLIWIAAGDIRSEIEEEE